MLYDFPAAILVLKKKTQNFWSMTDLSWPEDRARGSAPCSTGERERGRLDRGPRCRRLAGPGEGCAFTGSFVFKSVYGARGAFNLHKFNYLCSGKRKMEFRVHSLYTYMAGVCSRVASELGTRKHTQCTHSAPEGPGGLLESSRPAVLQEPGCGPVTALPSRRCLLSRVVSPRRVPAPHHARHGTRTAGLCFRKFALRTHVVTANLL